MSEDNNHINYSAADIQRYIQGKMTPQEMHTLEKAALDDEFLADAIEGYAYAPDDDHSKIVAGLKESLAAKTGGAKVVPLKGGWKQWYRIAAALFILLGSAAILYKYVFTEKITPAENIAQSKKEAVMDTTATAAASIPVDSSPAIANAVSDKDNVASTLPPTEKDKTTGRIAAAENAETKKTASTYKDAVSAAPDKTETKTAMVVAKEKEIAVADQRLNETQKLNTAVPAQVPTQPAARLDNEEKAKNAFSNYATNIFKGRVVDKNNGPLPYARIAIKNDSLRISTYADVKGYFSLIAPDSVLEVEAFSVGYANNTYRLQKGLIGENKIVLKESSQPLNEVVIAKSTAKRKRTMMDIIKDSSNYAIPEDGWSNYDTYLTNNLVVPQQSKYSNLHGQIELSFTVDKTGKPQNITVEKSLNSNLDSEAVKAIKEGPRWKSQKRKAKGKITIRF